jgi:YdjC-like protein
MPRVEAVWARVVTDLGRSAMAAKRYLIVNADDFGQSEGINQGVMEAHERGLVTSASLMVRWPAAIEAAAYSRAHPSLSLGLHVDLGEWTYGGDRWLPLYERVSRHDMAGREVFGEQLKLATTKSDGMWKTRVVFS